jgi:kynurenine formamidase
MLAKWFACGSIGIALFCVGPNPTLRAQNAPQPVPPAQADGYPLLGDAEFSVIFEQISNWGRWGKDDVKGTYNLLTPEKRKQAAALVKTGQSVSLEHTIIETKGPDVTNPLQKFNHGNKLVWESIHGGTYHSHVDALCHYDYKGALYNGMVRKEVETDEGCGKAGIDLYGQGFVTRGVLIDIPRLKGVPWLEPGTPVTLKDLEAWEQQTGIKVLPGDAVFLRTGKWAKRAKDGPWAIGWGPDAGWHWSVLPWLKARDVAIVGGDGPNDVRPAFVDPSNPRFLPIHTGVIAGLGAIILDGQDLEDVAALAAKLNRWEFMMTGAPLKIAGGGGSSINVIATF